MDLQRILEYLFHENLRLISQFVKAVGRKVKDNEVKFLCNQIACSRKKWEAA